MTEIILDKEKIELTHAYYNLFVDLSNVAHERSENPKYIGQSSELLGRAEGHEICARLLHELMSRIGITIPKRKTEREKFVEQERHENSAYEAEHDREPQIKNNE